MNRDYEKVPPQYTCNDYREEMILLALRHKLQQSDLSDEERAKLKKEIARLEKAIGF
jgi:hypothetical protein